MRGHLRSLLPPCICYREGDGLFMEFGVLISHTVDWNSTILVKCSDSFILNFSASLCVKCCTLIIHILVVSWITSWRMMMVGRCFKPYCNWTLWHFTLCISLVCMKLTPLFYPLRWHQPEDDVASSVRVQTRFERRGVPVCQERVRLQSLRNQLNSSLKYSLSFHTETRVQIHI